MISYTYRLRIAHASAWAVCFLLGHYSPLFLAPDHRAAAIPDELAFLTAFAAVTLLLFWSDKLCFRPRALRFLNTCPSGFCTGVALALVWWWLSWKLI